MSKNLPYFRFTVAEWLNGDISFEDYKLKGIFIDICAYYWFKDCTITLEMLEKRFRDVIPEIHYLLDAGIINVNESGFLSVAFLDEQFIKLSELHKIRKDAGSKGGKQSSSKTQALLKQSSSYKDKDKDKEKDKDSKEIDYDFVVSNYHSLCPNMNHVKVITSQRKDSITAIVEEFGMERVVAVLRIAGECDFLNGKNEKGWKAEFDWIIDPGNFVKIMERKYTNKVKKRPMVY